MNRLRLLAILEATSITGPAKNLLQFVAQARKSFQPLDVHLAVFHRGGVSNLFLDAARAASIPVHTLEEKGRFDRAVLAQLHSVFRDVAPDILQTHAVKSHFLVRSAGLQRAVPWVAFHHGYTWPDLRMRLYNQLDRWSLRQALRVVTVSIPFRDELVRKGISSERIEIVHNAVDPCYASADTASADVLRASLGIGPQRAVILTVGRLSREKDHQTLLAAIQRLGSAELGRKPHLVIVGEGPERLRILETVAALGLDDAVTLTGQQPSAAPYYAIADIVVLSSLSEGSPNALLEAMAARAPVVSTAVGGVPEIAEHGRNALLVGRRDPAAMANAIAALLADPAMARGLAERAHELILSRYTPEFRTRRLIEIYQSVAGR